MLTHPVALTTQTKRNLSAMTTYTFRMQKNMERIFNLSEDRNPMLSDQNLYTKPIANQWNAVPWNKNKTDIKNKYND